MSIEVGEWIYKRVTFTSLKLAYLKNSQPMHLLFLLRPEFWKKSGPRTLIKLNEELYKKITQRDRITDILMFLKPKNSFDLQGVGIADFFNLVKNGKLYEFICNNFCGQYVLNSIDRFDKRDKAKVEVLRMLYFDHRRKSTDFYAPYHKFELLFPTVTKVIETLKEDKYTNFPKILQGLEAQVILHEISKQFTNKYPGAPIFTIHDSVITTRQYYKVLKYELENTYKNHLGFTPAVEEKELHPSEADTVLNKYCQRKLDESNIPSLNKEDLTDYKVGADSRRMTPPFPNLEKELAATMFYHEYYTHPS